MALALIIVSAAVVVGVPPRSGAASTATYLVEAYGTITWGQTPQFGIRVESALPAGASITGAVTCTTVYVNNIPTPVANLNAGSYELDTTTCKSTPTYPLTLKGATGQIQILGGQYTVHPDPTTIVGAVNVTRSNPAAPAVTFTAELFQTGDTQSLLGTQKLSFTYQSTQDMLFVPNPGCTTQRNTGTVTTPSTHIQTTPPTALAVCNLSQQSSTEFVDGTGKVYIAYLGTSHGNYAPSTVWGSYSTAKTSATQAAKNLKQAQIQVVPTRTPRTCHPNETQTGVSIIGVSLAAMTCKTLKILQTVTQYVLALGSPLSFVTTYIVTPIVKGVVAAQTKQVIQQQEQNKQQPRTTTFDVVEEETGFVQGEAALTDVTEATDVLEEF
ncbi:MAG: hypothetical protein ACYDHU_06510 [Acidimicrobiales bacterium]